MFKYFIDIGAWIKRTKYILSSSAFCYSCLAIGGNSVYFALDDTIIGGDINGTTSGQVIKIDVDLTKAAASTGKVIRTECNVGSFIDFPLFFFHRLGIPDRVQMGSKWVDVTVEDSSGWVKESGSPDSYTYYYWNEENGGGGFKFTGDTCFPVGSYVGMTSINAAAPPTNHLILSVRVPPDLPDGVSYMEIPMKYGKNVNFPTSWFDANRHRKDMMSISDSVAVNGVYVIHKTKITNHARCSFDKPSYEIDHKDVSLNEALKNNVRAGVNVNLICTIPTDVEIKLSTDKQSNYKHDGKLSVNLGKGWDSLISLNGYPYDKDKHTTNYVTQSGQSFRVESTLYGERARVEAGAINGSLIMTFYFK